MSYSLFAEAAHLPISEQKPRKTGDFGQKTGLFCMNLPSYHGDFKRLRASGTGGRLSCFRFPPAAIAYRAVARKIPFQVHLFQGMSSCIASPIEPHYNVCVPTEPLFRIIHPHRSEERRVG